jgi:hypothetical protein
MPAGSEDAIDRDADFAAPERGSQAFDRRRNDGQDGERGDERIEQPQPSERAAEPLESVSDQAAENDVAAGRADGDNSGNRRRRRRRRRRRGGAPSDGPDAGDAHGQGQPAPPPQREPRHSHREQRRRGHGGRQGNSPRDVDVVPRYRDRRGKVDVIEPAALDLSAFDVELDPKRVPTFGTIVEGKGRPKRKSPRVPDDGVDTYKPPPPPGSDGPGAPPPPPPNDPVFGDW